MNIYPSGAFNYLIYEGEFFWRGPLGQSYDWSR